MQDIISKVQIHVHENIIQILFSGIIIISIELYSKLLYSKKILFVKRKMYYNKCVSTYFFFN